MGENIPNNGWMSGTGVVDGVYTAPVYDTFGVQRAVGLGLPYYDVLQMANIVVAIVIIVTGLVSFWMVAKGGFQLMIAGGDADAHKNAMVVIRNALMGMFLVIISYSLIAYVGRFLGYDLIAYVSFEKISEIVNGWSYDLREASLR